MNSLDRTMRALASAQSAPKTVFPDFTPIQIIRAECTDLWAESEGGWSANCSWVRRRTLVVASAWSDAKVARRIKQALGIQGMRVDRWAGADWGWRAGCVGAYADVVS